MAPKTSGIHHITAIASDPQRNLEFYTGALGLRLVKLTINFDDPGTYHFYFGNEEGAPGSILTFFPWPGVPRGRAGNRHVSASAFAVPVESREYWITRLRQRHVAVDEAGLRFGEGILQFADPDGLPLEIICTASANPALAWQAGPVAAGHAICGFHSATLSEEGYEQTARLLRDVLGFEPVGNEGNRYRFAASAGAGAGSLVDILCTPDRHSGRQGAGTVHHIAWRARDDAEQITWRADLQKAGVNVTPVIDRTYFHSIYFREPGGILFEIATDPPGFTADEPQERLGERLMLPSWLEGRRDELARVLPPLTRPGAVIGADRPGDAPGS